MTEKQIQIQINSSFLQQFHLTQNHIQWLKQYIDYSNLTIFGILKSYFNFSHEYELGQDGVSLITFQKQKGFVTQLLGTQNQEVKAILPKIENLLVQFILNSYYHLLMQGISLDKTTFSQKTCHPKVGNSNQSIIIGPTYDRFNQQAIEFEK
ncbi:unnamed protein product [Paramecium pentaurelia]|uniref:Uncharacterized protein n=1 Tax=Paramecium pentaurelia TaxID=43138 RepID=A0A8S1VQ04_9CILI|nr:unnamed protein product [Paramecium pentaurelia]